MQSHHETAAKSLGASDSDIAKINALHPNFNWGGLLKTLLPIVLQIVGELGKGDTSGKTTTT